uniref:phosphoglycerate kinase n=1 Tax=Nicotiana sylvestris TaxID=4096 RepID=A0A1U7V2G9_NICSY|nr:PREDICTED: phosphoglycerate kinase, cytosolic-like [Nicotiana sylvestris]
MLDPAKSLIEKAKENGVSLFLAVDVVIANKYSAGANRKVVPVGVCNCEHPFTIAKATVISELVADQSLRVLPLVQETQVLNIRKIKEKGVINCDVDLPSEFNVRCHHRSEGVESITAVEKVGLADKMSHISMGGFASKELHKGIPLHRVLALDDDA